MTAKTTAPGYQSSARHDRCESTHWAGLERLRTPRAQHLLHDNDLVRIDASPEERNRIVREFKQALDDHCMKVPMATRVTNTSME